MTVKNDYRIYLFIPSSVNVCVSVLQNWRQYKFRFKIVDFFGSDEVEFEVMGLELPKASND